MRPLSAFIAAMVLQQRLRTQLKWLGLGSVCTSRNVAADGPAVKPPTAVTDGDTSRSDHARQYLRVIASGKTEETGTETT